MAPGHCAWTLWLAGLLALACVTWQATILAPSAEGLSADGQQTAAETRPKDPRLQQSLPVVKLAKHIFKGAPREDRSYFFSIGDFGVAACEEAYKAGHDEEMGGIGFEYCAARHQVSVAEQMARLAAGLNPSFVLSLGDNFYVRGVRSLDDPQFNESFENIYDRGALAKVPWRISVGDHDQRGNVTALLLHTHRSSRWRLPAPYYTFEVPTPSAKRHIQVIICDSVGLEGAADPKLLQGRRWGSEFSDEYTGPAAGQAQWRWLEETLASHGGDGAAARPALRIVVGHRPALSMVRRDRTAADKQVMHRLRELLRRASAHGPVLYLHGHDHAMQHTVEEGGALQHVGNGVGGLNLHPFVRELAPEFRWGYTSGFGFAVHEVGEDSMTMHFVSADGGEVIHTIEIPFATA